MTEAQVGLLVKATACFEQSGINRAHNILKSFYLMRCREVTKGYGLPDKYFSPKIRCSHCFTEWKSNTNVKIRAISLSKRQRKRIKQLKSTNNNKDYVQSRKNLLKSNELEQICSFCKHSTVTALLKPLRPNSVSKSNSPEPSKNKAGKELTESITKNNKKKKNNAKGQQIQRNIKKVEVNVYSKTKDVFSLANKDNSLAKAVKEEKVIKNNKKKKDKFAGLCQQAVLASAKLKQEKEKQNKLNLFLKPSAT